MEVGEQNQAIEAGRTRARQSHLLNAIERVDGTQSIAINAGLQR